MVGYKPRRKTTLPQRFKPSPKRGSKRTQMLLEELQAQFPDTDIELEQKPSKKPKKKK